MCLQAKYDQQQQHKRAAYKLPITRSDVQFVPASYSDLKVPLTAPGSTEQPVQLTVTDPHSLRRPTAPSGSHLENGVLPPAAHQIPPSAPPFRVPPPLDVYASGGGPAAPALPPGFYQPASEFLTKRAPSATSPARRNDPSVPPHGVLHLNRAKHEVYHV